MGLEQRKGTSLSRMNLLIEIIAVSYANGKIQKRKYNHPETLHPHRECISPPEKRKDPPLSMV